MDATTKTALPTFLLVLFFSSLFRFDRKGKAGGLPFSLQGTELLPAVYAGAHSEHGRIQRFPTQPRLAA